MFIRLAIFSKSCLWDSPSEMLDFVWTTEIPAPYYFFYCRLSRQEYGKLISIICYMSRNISKSCSWDNRLKCSSLYRERVFLFIYLFIYLSGGLPNAITGNNFHVHTSRIFLNILHVAHPSNMIESYRQQQFHHHIFLFIFFLNIASSKCHNGK